MPFKSHILPISFLRLHFFIMVSLVVLKTLRGKGDEYMRLHEVRQNSKIFTIWPFAEEICCSLASRQKLIFYVDITIFDVLDHLKMYHIFNKLFMKSLECSI